MGTSSAMSSVDSIRPDSLADQQQEAQKADNEWLATKRNFFETSFCPICGTSAQSITSYHLENGLYYNRCTTCATLFLGERPNAPTYKEFYEISAGMKLFATYIFPQSYTARLDKIYRPRLARMLDYFNQARARERERERAFLKSARDRESLQNLSKTRTVFLAALLLNPLPAWRNLVAKMDLTSLRSRSKKLMMKLSFLMSPLLAVLNFLNI